MLGYRIFEAQEPQTQNLGSTVRVGRYFCLVVCFLDMLLLTSVLLVIAACPFTRAERWSILGNQHSTSTISIHDNTGLALNPKLLPGHSCYDATLNGTTLHFCYPSLIVSGAPKAGTSALYELISEHPHYIGAKRKENCVKKNTTDAMWTFFTALQEQTQRVLSQEGPGPFILISGCICQECNIWMDFHLRKPKAKYILITRDLSELGWAAFNFWCSEGIDGAKHCLDTVNQWSDVKYHYRSPELFHEIVVAQSLGKQSLRVPNAIHHDVFQKDFYWQKLQDFVNTGISANRVIFVASEVLSENATAVWTKVVSRVSTVPVLTEHPTINTFGSKRINSGDHKGTNTVSNQTDQGSRGGVYAISGHRPILDKTREIIASVWMQDCIWTSQITGYAYPACHA